MENDNRPASLQMFLSTFFALCGAMTMGCVVAWSGTALENMKEEGSEPRIRSVWINGTEKVNPDDEEYETWMSSCITLGALAGSLISSLIVGFFGARKTLIAIGIPMIGGWALICFAKSFIVIIIGRTITGFCSGIVASSAPGYVSDLVTPKTRGFLGSGFQIMVCVGLLYEISFGTFLSWNQLSYISVIPMAICSVGMIFSPESPIRLVEMREDIEALEVLTRIRGDGSDIHAELKELQERVHSTKGEASAGSSGIRIILRPDVYHPAIIAVMLMVFQQFSGINAVMFYLTNIFSGGSMDPKIAAIMVDSIMVVATIISAAVMDRFGRKVLLLFSGAGHVLSLTLMGYYYKQVEPESSWIPVACLMMFVVFFSFGYGPIPWMIVGEITPNEAKPLVGSLGSSANWLCAFLITKDFEAVIELIHKYGAYWLFAGCSVLSLVYTWFLVPETKHKSIEDMQRHFLGK